MMNDCIRLGVEVTFQKKLKALQQDVKPAILPDRIPVWKGIPLDVSHLERTFEYELTEMKPTQDVCIKAGGLSQLYVCFGAPGTGKSYLIRGLLQQMLDGWDQEWGGLILDPKQTLIKESDLQQGFIPEKRRHVISPDTGTNLLNGKVGNNSLRPRDLGVALALAAESAGISTKDAYWLNELKRIFGAGLAFLELEGEILPEEKRPLTLRRLAEFLLDTEPVANTTRTQPVLIGRLRRAEEELGQHAERDPAKELARELKRTRSELNLFNQATGNNADTVRSFVSQVLSPFLSPDLDYVSDESDDESIAERIIADGKWILIKVPRNAMGASRMLSALAKILFQRAALSRYEAYPDNKRRIFLFVDEYAELASDLPGEGFGDSIFFSQAREFLVFSFIATQGVPMLENSGVKEAWKTILSNSAGKIFFRVADPDTAELASKLLGEGSLLVSDRSVTQSLEGGSIQRGEKLERRTLLSSDLFAVALKQGQFAVIGSVEGTKVAEGDRERMAGLRYVWYKG